MSLLVDKVAQTLGVSRDTAAERVQRLVDEIRSSTDDDASVHVEGLGTFRTVDGDLNFDPDTRLASVVNHRFAGLAPIPVESVGSAAIDASSFAMPDIPIAVPGTTEPSEVAPTFQGADHDEISDDARAIERDVSDLDRASDATRPQADESLSAATADKSSVLTDDSPATAPGDHDLGVEDYSAQLEETPAAEPVGASAAADVAGNDPEEVDALGAGRQSDVEAEGPGGAERTEPKTPADPATPASGKPPAVVKRKSRALPYFGVIVVLLLAIAGVLYVISRGDGFPPPPEEVVGDNDGRAGEGSEALPATPPPVTWEPGAIDRRVGGYTLIVSSQPTIEEASAVALELSQTLADEGLPIDVLRGTARGETWYRVAIGQFSRQSIATQQLRRLAEKLPEGAWVLRIRTTM